MKFECNEVFSISEDIDFFLSARHLALAPPSSTPPAPAAPPLRRGEVRLTAAAAAARETRDAAFRYHLVNL